MLPNETLRQLVMRIGGVTGNAYIYGAQFTRESTREQQQRRLDEALDKLEAEAARAATERSQNVMSKEEGETLGQQVQAQKALIVKLRQIKATGRIVLEVPRNNATIKHMPALALEDGDHLFIPAKPSTVSVFGAVYNQNDFIYRDGKDVGDYLEQAGGPTKDADKGSVYLVKADGSVVSRQQKRLVLQSIRRPEDRARRCGRRAGRVDQIQLDQGTERLEPDFLPVRVGGGGDESD